MDTTLRELELRLLSGDWTCYVRLVRMRTAVECACRVPLNVARPVARLRLERAMLSAAAAGLPPLGAVLSMGAQAFFVSELLSGLPVLGPLMPPRLRGLVAAYNQALKKRP